MTNRKDVALSLAACWCLCGTGSVMAQTWPDVNAGLIPVQHSAIAWGDFDNDNDLDIIVTGWSSKGAGEPTFSLLYRNDGGGSFVATGAVFTPVQCGAVAWGDYDRDGDLDLAISGQTDVVNYSRLTSIYRNDGGSFTNIAAGLPGVNNGSLAWGDYDNDGDLDLAVSGWTGTERFTRIYRNDGATFTNSGVNLTGVNYGQIAWADYDNDGDLDLAVCGWAGGSSRIMKIYRNTGGSFVDIGAGIPGVEYAALAWGDYDNNGEFDLLVSGYRGSGAWGSTVITSAIFANDGGAFSDAVVGLAGPDGRGNVQFSSNAFGDYDNDGLSDVIVAGWCETPGMATRVNRILHNNSDSGPFTDINAGLGAMQYCSVAWGDYDNDGDLDIASSGQVGGADWERTRVHRNDFALAPNSPPTAPGGLSASMSGSSVTFNWTAASDAETPAGGLTYNLRVGTAPGTDNIFCAMANLTTGYRRLPAHGNVQKRLSWTLNGITGAVYWSVQAIDGAYAGGAWAPEAHVP